MRQGLPAPSVAPVQRMEGRFPDPHPLGEGLHFVWLACMLLVAWRVSAASPLYVDVDPGDAWIPGYFRILEKG